MELAEDFCFASLRLDWYLSRMKYLVPISFLLLFVSCNHETEGKFLLGNTNNKRTKEFQWKEKKDPWIPSNELREFAKNAPRIETIKGIAASFDSLDYNQIVAYKFWNTGDRNPQVFRNGRYLVTEIEKQVALNQDQADRMIRFLNKPSTYGGMRMSCFEPRFGLVFYKDGKMVTQINICMECNYLTTEVTIPAYEAQKGKIINGEDYRPNKDFGFTKKAWKTLDEFHKEFGFQEEK